MQQQEHEMAEAEEQEEQFQAEGQFQHDNEMDEDEEGDLEEPGEGEDEVPEGGYYVDEDGNPIDPAAYGYQDEYDMEGDAGAT